jgi:hypothetical protein
MMIVTVYVYVGTLRLLSFIRKDFWVTTDGPDTDYDDALDRQKIDRVKKRRRSGQGRE